MSDPKRTVAYFYDSNVGNYHYAPGHPMKPHRIRMTHNLVMSYGLYKKMAIYRAAPATRHEMTQFHSDDYVDFLYRVTPDNAYKFHRELTKYNMEEDCPVFDGMFDFFSLSAGSSMEGAARLNRGLSDICINWSGGLHHAKKCEASGFCYINDIVLAILELLRHHQRVLYIDIDVHHGDGVEEAFYTTDRVMTCSFHKYGEYFPGTGDLRDIGETKGKYYSVNFPLRDGIDDESYCGVFEPVVQSIMDWYQPNAVVLQCGADSLAGDKLGCFNLSMNGHGKCVSFVKSFGLPTLVLGGGGYTIRNVSRTWAYETGLLVGANMESKLPMNDYMDYFGPDYTLSVPPHAMENTNSREYLERIKTQVLQNLERTKFVPSVQMQEIPRDPDYDNVDEDNENPDVRSTQSMRDAHVVPECEMHEDDAMGQLSTIEKSDTRIVNEDDNSKTVKDTNIEPTESSKPTEQPPEATTESSDKMQEERPDVSKSSQSIPVDTADEKPEVAESAESQGEKPQKQSRPGTNSENKNPILNADKMDVDESPIDSTETKNDPNSTTSRSTPIPTKVGWGSALESPSKQYSAADTSKSDSANN